jgi:DNA repair ATPase RecN
MDTNTQGIEIKGYTPGPWHFVEYAGYIGIQREPFYDAPSILNIEDVGESEFYSNAKLLAAAPQLLEQNIELQAINENLRKDIAGLIEEKNGLNNDISELVDELGKLESKLEFTETKLTTIEKQYNYTNTLCYDFKEENKRLLAERDELKKAVANLPKWLYEAEGVLNIYANAKGNQSTISPKLHWYADNIAALINKVQ